MPAVATKTKSVEIPPTREPNKARHVREIIVGAIEAGRELTAAEAAEINKAFVGEQVRAVTAVVKQFASDVSAGATLERFRPVLQNLLDGGAAGAIFDVAKRRHALQMEFEKTPWHARKLQLLKHRDERAEEFEAAQANEDTSPAKLKRLGGEYEQSLKFVNDHLNSRDADLVGFRHAMEPTSEPTFSTCDWRMFAI